MLPGEYVLDDKDIEINAGRERLTLEVSNCGDRPIQVGSHYHFAEANMSLEFDRTKAGGFRLNIPAGTAVRFEPGASRTVELVRMAGNRSIFGFRGEVMGPLEN